MEWKHRHETSKAALWIRRALGAAYLVAGVAKCAPAVESTPQRLAQALHANRGHPEERLTRRLGEHAVEASTVVAVAMTGAGCVLLDDDSPVTDAVLAMTLPMLGGFMLILRRAVPQVIPIDLVFGGTAVYLLINRRRGVQRRKSAS